MMQLTFGAALTRPMIRKSNSARIAGMFAGHEYGIQQCRLSTAHRSLDANQLALLQILVSFNKTKLLPLIQLCRYLCDCQRDVFKLKVFNSLQAHFGSKTIE